MLDCVILSVGQPQLMECLESVRSQIVPFSNVIHIDGISPQAKAWQLGMEKTKSQWVMRIGGDFILDNTATQTAIKYINKNEKLGLILFGLYDEFLKQMIYGCSVENSKAVMGRSYRNILRNDLWLLRQLRKDGWRIIKKIECRVGTHFKDPTTFQIFSRFYALGVKQRKKPVDTAIRRLFAETGDPRYELAIKAVKYGVSKKHYPTSHDIEFDKKIWDEFNENLRCHSSV